MDMDALEALKERLCEQADSLAATLCEMSDAFYRNPEVGLEEVKTSEAMARFLAGRGFAVTRGVAGLPTAFRAQWGRGRPAVALLAEMDALPGVGHGCGHNIGGMASVGAASALAAVLDETSGGFRGRVVVLGTPGEEIGRGKADMIKAGEFDGIDAAMMVHPSGSRTVVKHFLGMVEIRFTFHGRGSHASAYPEEGINALDAVIQTFNSINALRQHLPPEARVHGIITDGGRAPNIIPDRAEALFYVRAHEARAIEELAVRVTRCAEGAAAATGCTVDVERVGGATSPMRLNAAFADAYRSALAYLDLPEDPKPPYRNIGSSDIGDVSQVVPAIHPHVPIGEGLKIHTREFASATAGPGGHRGLVEGVKCLGLTALELFFRPAVLEGIRREFEAAEGAKGRRCG